MIRRLLLCTDMDRTLIPNGSQPESPGAREVFTKLAKNPQVTLVYVTGRHLELTGQAIESYCLPLPAYIVADVGSTIYKAEGAEWIDWRQWEDEISPDWAGRSNQEIISLLNHMSEPGQVDLQETEKQNHYKVSYYLNSHMDYKKLIESMKERLREDGIKASLIYSFDESADTGLLDILPAGATKKHAVEFLMDRLGFSLVDTVFAGDSGNDIPVLTGPIQAVLVANGSDDVREQALKESHEQGNDDLLYLAKGGYRDMNGNYSAGILEGVAHYVPEASNWF